MLPTQVHTTKARVTPARKRSTSQKRGVSTNALQQQRANSQNQDPVQGAKKTLKATTASRNGMIAHIPKPLKRDESGGVKRSNSSPKAQTKMIFTKDDAPLLEKSPARLNIQTGQCFDQGIKLNADILSTVSSAQSSQFHNVPPSLEIACRIFKKAAQKYGSKLNHKQVDSVIRRSEYAGNTDKATRKFLKSILLNFERNGTDPERAIKLEVVKHECSQLAWEHYKHSLLSKGLFSLINMMIRNRSKDPQSYYNHNRSAATNTTLHRMLEGVISVSKQSQLDEFVQIERTLETEMSETLTSEPDMCSGAKPPKAQGGKRPVQITLNTAAIMSSNYAVQPLTGVQSPSVNDLQGDFQAFCDDESIPVNETSLKKTFMQSTLDLNTILPQEPQDGIKTGCNREQPVPFFMGHESTFGGQAQNTTHLKISHLFKTAAHSSIDTHVDEQIKRLDGIEAATSAPLLGEDGQSNELDVEMEGQQIMASYVRKQTLLRKGFSSLQTLIYHKKTQTAEFRVGRQQSQEQPKRQKSIVKSKERSQDAIKEKSSLSKKVLAKRTVAPKVTPALKAKRDVSQEKAVQEIPVKPVKQAKSVISESNLSAPNFQSCLSSPRSRLQSILTDKKPSSIFYSHQTSRRTVPSQSPTRTENWQSANVRQLVFLEQSGVRLRLKFLKRQIFKCLEYNLHQMKVKEATADRFFKQRALKALRCYLFEKNRQRKLVELYAQSRQERLMVTAFRNWRGVFFEIQIVDQYRHQSLLKRGFNCLLSGTVHAQQCRQISIVCRKHFADKALQRIIQVWSQRAKDNGPHRRRCRQIFADMKHYRVSKWIKAWFNQIDLLKHEQALQNDVLQSHAKRVKRHFFVVWLAKYLKEAKRKERLTKLANFSQENFARRFFKPWLVLSRKRSDKRHTFFQMRAKHLNEKAFLAFKINLYNSNGDRLRTRKLVLMRATRLIRTAFYGGFVANRKLRETSRQRKRVALDHFQAQAVIKTFRAFQSLAISGRKGKTIRCRSKLSSTAKFFQQWHELTQNVVKAKKMRTKNLIELQFKVLKALYENASSNKVYQTIMSHCLQQYSYRLLRTGLKGLSQNIVTRHAKREIVSEINDYYQRKLQSKSLEAFQLYTQQSKTYARLITRFLAHTEDTRQAFAFRKLAAYRNHRQFKRSYIPLLSSRNTQTKERCFYAMKEWKNTRQYFKGKLSQHLNYRQGCALEVAFENLVVYSQVSKEKKELKARANDKRRATLLDKAMQTLAMHTVCKLNQKSLVRGVEKIRRRTLFVTWFNHVHDEIPAERKADEFYIRTIFDAIRSLAIQNRALRAKRILLKQLSSEYYPYMLKKRGVCMWRAVADRTIFVSSVLQTQQRNKLHKLFDSWWNNVDRLGEGKARDIMQRELNKRFHYRRVLTALKIHTEEKQHQKSIIAAFQNKHNMIEKARVFSGLIQGSCQDRVDLNVFVNAMLPQYSKLVKEAFHMWRNNLHLARHDDMAELFYAKRANKFLLKRCFDRLRIGSSKLTKKNMKDEWLGKVRSHVLLRQCLIDLQLYAKKKMKLGHAWGLASQRAEQRLKSKVLRVLASNMIEKVRLSEIETKIVTAFNNIKLRKVIIALQSYTAQSIKGKLVQAKWGLRIKDKFLARWLQQMHNSAKMSRMCQILQEQNYLKFIQAFMVKLDDAGDYMAFKKHLDGKLRAKSLQALKQNWLLGKMSTSLNKKHLQSLQRKVFTALRLNQINRINLRETVEQQAELQAGEDNFYSLQNCFNVLKENRYKKRATRIARGTFGLSVLKRAFSAMQAFTLKQKVLQVNLQEMIVLRKQRYLHKWLNEFDRAQREQNAGAIINFDRLHLVMQAWKKFTHDEKLVRQFRVQTYHRGLKATVISSLQKNLIIENFQRIMYVRIKERQDAELKRDAFAALRAGTKLRTIQNNMRLYHLLKFQKGVVKAWKCVVDRKNKQRIDLIKKRAAFHEKPYLAKPLLAMRNMLIFRAFRSIMLNANRRKEFKFNRQICTYSIYLRLQRKAFYAMRLNAAARFQKKKSKEIKRLMIQRRWFTYLKRVTQLAKLKRKKQTDAAIFRFLSLQRRGILQWVSFVSKMKRVKIKRHFALTLYYNRMCDKVMTTLKVNAQVKSRKRRETSQADGYITTSSSEIMQEASFTHRSKLNLSSLQQYVNNSTHQLRQQLEDADMKALSSVQHQVSHEFLMAPYQEGPQNQNQQPITTLMNLNRLMADSNNALLQQQQEQTKSGTNYQNFYKQPIEQIEPARANHPQHDAETINQQLIYNNQQYMPQMAQLHDMSCSDQNMLLIATSLPTPQANTDTNGDFQVFNGQQLCERDDPQQQQQQPLSAHHLQHQLTLGTMPDQITNHHKLGNNVGMSSATHQETNNNANSDQLSQQQWLSSHTSPVACLLCQEGIQHDHHHMPQLQEMASEQMQSNTTAGQSHPEVQQNLPQYIMQQKHQTQQYLSSDNHNPYVDSHQAPENDNNISSFVEYQQDSRASSAFDVVNKEAEMAACTQMDPPERDHDVVAQGTQQQQRLQQHMHQRQPSNRYLESAEQNDEHTQDLLLMRDSADYSQDEYGCYVVDDEQQQDNTTETVQRRIQFNMNKMNGVLGQQSNLTSFRSTPDITMNHAIDFQTNDQYLQHQQATVNQFSSAQSQNHHRNHPGSKSGSKVYSHTSSLKTTPGMMNTQKMRKRI